MAAGDGAEIGAGLASLRAGRPAEAIGCFERVLRRSPGNVDALLGFGRAALALRHAGHGLQAFDLGLALQPERPDLHVARAGALLELQRPAEAEAACARALELQPRSAEGCLLRGQSLLLLERPAEALPYYEQAAALLPGFAPAHSDLGYVLAELDRLEEAVQACRRATALDPALLGAHMNLGMALQRAGDLEIALASFGQAMSVAPDCAEAHWNAGLCLLQLGRFTQGWHEYEWRKRMAHPLGARQFPCPPWLGAELLAGKTVRLHSEQGLGDTLQFCRFATQVRALGATVVLSVQSPLTALLRSLDPSIQVIGEDEAAPADYHCPLLSLPLALGVTVDSIPDAGAYLHADPARVQGWRERLGTRGFKVGIRWQGRPGIRADIGRSFPLAAFAQLAAIPGVRLISLQKGAGTEQLGTLPAGMAVESVLDADEGSDSFLDTAALIEALDLVISCDTSVAHLSGALGRPTWLALRSAPEWRWLAGRADSPWYRGHRLFRQSRPGDWDSVAAGMKLELLALLAQRPA